MKYIIAILAASFIACANAQDQVPAAPPASNSKIPYATPVSGKPGFVISPYAPKEGYVDVRGYKAGTEVKDPYSGKVFLVP
jgi:hypothetical protein